MQTTKVTQTLAPAGFTPAGKLTHLSRGLLLVLAVLIAKTAWSQSPPNFRDARRPPPPSTLASTVESLTNAQATTHYKFITIEADSSTNAVADGINNDGLVSGYFEDSSSVYHGFLWHDGGFKKVDYRGGAYTKLYSVNNRGVVIGFYGNSTGTAEHTVTYATQSHQWTLLPDISGYPYNEGYGINDEGVAVGNAFSSSGSSVAWIWDPKTLSYSFFTVPGADANSTSPSGLNDKDQIAGYYSTGMGSAYHGFLREYGTYTTIDAPGASYTFLDGLNNSGIIQGQIYDAAGAAEGFVASSGGVFTMVNDTNATNTALVGINDLGDVCGSYWDTFGINTAFVALRLEER